jgi:hypothetical protein
VIVLVIFYLYTWLILKEGTGWVSSARSRDWLRNQNKMRNLPLIPLCQTFSVNKIDGVVIYTQFLFVALSMCPCIPTLVVKHRHADVARQSSFMFQPVNVPDSRRSPYSKSIESTIKAFRVRRMINKIVACRWEHDYLF